MLEKNALRIKHLIFGFSTGAIAFHMLLSSSYVSNESAPMLMIFNFLFISLIFPLRGSLTTKICMLLAGNVIGAFWANLLSLFIHAAGYYFGEIFNVLYIILNPLINLVWIVSFWSVSLSVLTNSEKEEASLNLDN